MVIEWTSGNTKNTYELTEHPLDTVQLSEDEASGTPEATSTGGDGGGSDTISYAQVDALTTVLVGIFFPTAL